MRLTVAHIRLIVFICLAGTPVARASLIVNGSFESPGASLTTDYTAIGTNTLPGWTSTAGNGPSAANYINATNSTANWIPNPELGNYSVQLDSSNDTPSYSAGGSIAQTVSLTANTQYTLSFYMSAETDRLDINNNRATCTSQLNVLLDGGGFTNQNMVNSATGTTGFLATWDGTPKASPEPSWVEWTLVFTPTVSGDVTITFQDVWVNNPASSNASLDNIDLEVVPEFAHWSVFALFIAVVMATDVFRRRRKPLSTIHLDDQFTC